MNKTSVVEVFAQSHVSCFTTQTRLSSKVRQINSMWGPLKEVNTLKSPWETSSHPWIKGTFCSHSQLDSYQLTPETLNHWRTNSCFVCLNFHSILKKQNKKNPPFPEWWCNVDVSHVRVVECSNFKVTMRHKTAHDCELVLHRVRAVSWKHLPWVSIVLLR